MAAQLPLRDVHLPPAPSWWPPAPGWWLLAAALLAVAAVVWFWRRRRARRRAAIERVFDQALAAAETPAAQVAAISELLRRAARRRDPQADRLQGEAWLEFLDRDSRRRDFAEGDGRVLLDGAYRREVEPGRVAALRDLARRRFLQWMGAGR
ncbi:DUF4381 family protein [Lysobacter firmicutimachus]|uniref:DUF4381 family protein n=2 Tax=Lysobacteraceae TaxID=32033 RepID=A0AAU8MV88_9GAMM|nr:DUF4381 family protein [Lysobacter antibioticus]